MLYITKMQLKIGPMGTITHICNPPWNPSSERHLGIRSYAEFALDGFEPLRQLRNAALMGIGESLENLVLEKLLFFGIQGNVER